MARASNEKIYYWFSKKCFNKCQIIIIITQFLFKLYRIILWNEYYTIVLVFFLGKVVILLKILRLWTFLLYTFSSLMGASISTDWKMTWKFLYGMYVWRKDQLLMIPYLKLVTTLKSLNHFSFGQCLKTCRMQNLENLGGYSAGKGSSEDFDLEDFH